MSAVWLRRVKRICHRSKFVNVIRLLSLLLPSSILYFSNRLPLPHVIFR
jgi:hypothetical protein